MSKSSELNIYLFDWGDTLMIDFPNSIGKMCDWDIVKTVDGAKETLAVLSKRAQIFIATGADDSTELEIKSAFERVGLSQYISGYFCKDNLGVSKGTSEFFQAILNQLNVAASHVAMVGDNLDKDIKPAQETGIQPFWFTQQNIEIQFDNIIVINKLTSLLTD